jgi:hypothetical protein
MLPKRRSGSMKSVLRPISPTFNALFLEYSLADFTGKISQMNLLLKLKAAKFFHSQHKRQSKQLARSELEKLSHLS